MTEDIHFTHDAAVVSVKQDAFVEQTDDNEKRIDWESLETVRVDDPPYVEAFDTKQFYKLPITAAKPVEQQYHYGDDGLLTLKKPRSELKRAAWSLDRRPVTLGHPKTKMVKSVDDIHGFHSDVEYYDSTDDLDANAYIPVDDEDAQEHIEENTDVSIGFHHRVTPTDEYEGIVGGSGQRGDNQENGSSAVGGTDSGEIDGFQTDLYINHSAFVKQGRCSSEQGCGLDTANTHGTVIDCPDTKGMPTRIKGTSGSDVPENEETTNDTMKQSVDQPDGIYEDDGDYYGVAPSENSDDEPKYELNNCSDVADAWKLRGHGHYNIEQSTLETRIKRMNEYLDCEHSLESDEDADSLMGQIEAAKDYTLVPEDCTDCPEHDTNLNMELNIDFDDLSTEAALRKIGESHDGLAEVADEYSNLEEVNEIAQTAADEVDSEVDELPDVISELKEDAEKYQEMRDEEMRESAEELASIVDKYEDADEVLEAYDSDYDAIEDRLELLESATETDEESEEEADTTQTTVDSEPDDGGQADSNRVVPDAWK